MSDNQVRNEIISNVELFWVKCNPLKPVEPFGELRWELQIQFPNDRAEEMEAYGKVKPTAKDGWSFINLTKKAHKADGSPAKPVGFVDSNKEELDARIVGNGSKGNVMVMLRDWEMKTPKGVVTKRGTKVMLNKVQVTELVEFKPSGDSFVDFDAAPAPKAAAKAAPKKNKALPADADF